VTDLDLSWTADTVGFHILGANGQPDAQLSRLVRPGLRRNPRRAHLLVSTVLGKHIPAEPRTIIGSGHELAAAVARTVDDAADVLAMAETATGLGGCVATELNAPVFVHTTRRPTTVPNYVEFEEGHSHATHHSVRPCPSDLLETSRPLVIVDDEISTGTTTLAAIAELHRRHPRSHYVMAALVDMRTGDQLQAAAELAAGLRTRIDAVSLATGRVVLPPDIIKAVHDLPAPQLNPVASTPGSLDRLQHAWPSALPDGGRHGFLDKDTQPFLEATAALADAVYARLDPARPTLVIGHEELMYLPLQLANALAEQGISARFQSTTRSPAYVRDADGYPLRRGYRFSASEADQTGPRFLYNGWPADDFGVPSQYVLVVDGFADTPKLSGAGGIEDVLTAAGHDLLTVVVNGSDPTALHTARRATPSRSC
jgi:adenine/guanine phosphoribosyltransferase-like PRPP-binding protein